MTIAEAIDVEAGVKFSAQYYNLAKADGMKAEILIYGPRCRSMLSYDLWPHLLGKGKICGDERFLIGENSDDEIVILHFDRRNPEKSERQESFSYECCYAGAPKVVECLILSPS